MIPPSEIGRKGRGGSTALNHSVQAFQSPKRAFERERGTTWTMLSSCGLPPDGCPQERNIALLSVCVRLLCGHLVVTMAAMRWFTVSRDCKQTLSWHPHMPWPVSQSTPTQPGVALNRSIVTPKWPCAGCGKETSTHLPDMHCRL